MPSTLAHTQSHYTRHSTFTQRIHLCTRKFGKLSIHTHTNIHTHTHAQKTIEAKCPKRNITNVFFSHANCFRVALAVDYESLAHSSPPTPVHPDSHLLHRNRSEPKFRHVSSRCCLFYPLIKNKSMYIPNRLGKH